MKPRRRVLTALVALTAVALLSGCEIKASLVLNDDGSGPFSYVISKLGAGVSAAGSAARGGDVPSVFAFLGGGVLRAAPG